GILVIWGCFWASVGHKICSDRILASISFDVKSYASIDICSSSRQISLARQTDHSSLFFKVQEATRKDVERAFG
ncbi:unnamed protein product, partial [Brassica oleracea]